MNMMYRPTVLNYDNYWYFKVFSLMVAVAVAAYILFEPASGVAYGGTWLGYVLGVISLLIVLLLLWYGITRQCTPRVPDRRLDQKGARRKQELNGDQGDVPAQQRRKFDRRKRSAQESWRYGGTLQGWLSSHIYMGAALVVLATLHTGFHFGWNIHTFSYVLMLLVIASGFYGVYAYLNFPRLITENMGNDTLDDMLLKVDELDELARIRALGLPDEVNHLVLNAREKTRLGGNFFQQIIGSQRDCPTALAAQKVLRLGQTYIKDEQPKLIRDLYSVLLHKEKLVLRVRREIMLKARLECWLYLHVPLSIALLAALIAHIVAIFFYW